jgi:phosphohistidine phosphatase
MISIESLSLLKDKYIFYSSNARRAFETACIFASNFSVPLDQIIINEELYTFDENQLEKVIKSLNNDLENVILFGHNAAITNFVNKFGDIFIENVPTSGFIWIKFESQDWKLIKKGNIHKVLFPRDFKI